MKCRFYINGAWSEWTEPYVSIESAGASGRWTYRKWSNGVAECWSKQTFACGGTAGTTTFAFPFPFTEEPLVTISPKHIPAGFFVGNMQGESTASGPEVLPNFDIYQANIQLLQMQGTDGTVFPAAENADFNVYCVGKWK